jgi:hypothetical protein
VTISGVALAPVAFLGQPPTAVAAASGSTCPDVAIIGVRGSGEDYQPDQMGMGVLPGAVAAAIVHSLPPGLSIVQIGLPYPADTVGGAVAEEFFHFLYKPFSDSIQAGASALFLGPGSLTDVLAQCRQTELVVVGHSQGAAVIDYGMMLAKLTGKSWLGIPADPGSAAVRRSLPSSQPCLRGGCR